MVKGQPGLSHIVSNGLITEVNHMNSLELEAVLATATLVICRSGYSSIMDLAVLGKKILLVPTPGQTEQEYLAGYLMSKKIAFTQTQGNFNLKIAFEQLAKIDPLPKTLPNSILPCAIKELICV
jgi:UDP-N-acetylglucosamine:LPS N-acetylglucosamine transferase